MWLWFQIFLGLDKFPDVQICLSCKSKEKWKKKHPSTQKRVGDGQSCFTLCVCHSYGENFAYLPTFFGISFKRLLKECYSERFQQLRNFSFLKTLGYFGFFKQTIPTYSFKDKLHLIKRRLCKFSCLHNDPLNQLLAELFLQKESRSEVKVNFRNIFESPWKPLAKNVKSVKAALPNVFLTDRDALHHLTFEDNHRDRASGQSVGSSVQPRSRWMPNSLSCAKREITEVQKTPVLTRRRLSSQQRVDKVWVLLFWLSASYLYQHLSISVDKPR